MRPPSGAASCSACLIPRTLLTAGRCVGARLGCRPASPTWAGAFGPGEQGGQVLALASLPFDQLGKGELLAVQPFALDLAGLAVNGFPDEVDRRLITLDGLVGERFRFPLTRLGAAEAVDQGRCRGQDL